MNDSGRPGEAGDSEQLGGPAVFWIYHLSRLIFGGWWLYSGLVHFVWPELQPLAPMASGLVDAIKLLEIALGLLILANRAMPLAVLALVPVNVVIVYWNFVLEEGLVEWTFALLSILFNALLAWPWRHHFRPLFIWKGKADFSSDPGIQDLRI